jgi:hypothetical protein
MYSKTLNRAATGSKNLRGMGNVPPLEYADTELVPRRLKTSWAG